MFPRKQRKAIPVLPRKHGVPATEGLSYPLSTLARMASEIGEWPTERLESELSVLAACLTAATARFVALVGEYDRRDGWLSWECRSAAE